MIRDALHSYSPEIFSRTFIAADGGEGTSQVFEDAGWTTYPVELSDPLRRRHVTYFMRSPDGKKVAIELSRICGSRFLSGEVYPLTADTYGLGEAIQAAIALNPEEIIIGLGGSASSDAGLGIFQAFQLVKGGDASTGLKAIAKGPELDMKRVANLQSKTEKIAFTVLYDTNALLAGPNGAVRVFGKQKGLNLFQRHFYDRAVSRWMRTQEKNFNLSLTSVPGLGAAGGVAAAVYSLFDAKLVSGSEYLLSLSGFVESATKADLIITGEGRFDQSSLSGKFAMKVIEIAHARQVPVLLLSARVEKDAVQFARVKYPLLEVIELGKFVDSKFLEVDELKIAIRMGIHQYFEKFE